MTNDIEQLVTNLIKEVGDKNPPKIQWAGNIYAAIKDLSIDQRGQVGEELVAHILKSKECNISYNPNRVDREKDWDIISNGIKIEIKLATIGKNGRTFQHESLGKERKFDALMLIDITPNEIYLSCYDYDELNWKKMHRRPNGLYKFDINFNALKTNQCLVSSVDDFYAKYKKMEEKTLKRLDKKPEEHML